MPQVVGWGNNIAGNLGKEGDDGYIDAPTVLPTPKSASEVVWSSWTCTIFRDTEGAHHVWGRHGWQDDKVALQQLDHALKPFKFIGSEQPVAILDGDEVTMLGIENDGDDDRNSWIDVVLTGLGTAYGVCEYGVFRYATLDDLIHGNEGTEIEHELLDGAPPATLYATESRVLLFIDEEPLVHVFELKEGKDGKTKVQLVEELEGLGVTAVVPGTANRFAFVTEAGDSYILRGRAMRAELLEVDDESPVKHVGIGSNFEVIVTEANVWVRGENKFSQLGLGEGVEDKEDAFVKHPYFDKPDRIRALHCARWSTIVEMHN